MARSSVKGKLGLLEDLKARGLVQDYSDPDLGRVLAEEKIAVYCGFDPTAESLQLGNLLPLTALARFQRAGHTPIVVLGGGTGMIGDPSGKSEERNLLDEATLARNVEAQKGQVARLLDFNRRDNPAIMVNNLDWLQRLNLIEFLRDVGKSFPLSVMLSRESVKRRLGSESGISFTEFTYQVLQAYDFYHLYTQYGCRLQVGGSDQYGNILAGVEYIRRVTGREHGAAGLAFPLITDSGGQKLGKTARGTIWLDAEKTSPYEWYQYWLNVDDRNAIRFLSYFTFMALEEIAAIERDFLASPKDRKAQKVLAGELTELVHGKEEARRAEKASATLFGDGEGARRPAKEAALPMLDADPGTPIVEVLFKAKFATSASEAKRLLQQGAVAINGVKVETERRTLRPTDWPGDGDVTILSAGPRRRVALRRSAGKSAS